MENNFAEILSVGENPVFVSVTVDNVTATAMLGSSFSGSLSELTSAINSASLTKNPDPYDLPDADSMLLQIEILRNGSAEQQGMDNCLMEFFKDGTLGVFGTEQFCGGAASYSLSEQDLKKIKTAAKKVAAERIRYPQPMRITDPLSSYSRSGAMIIPAGRSWNYADPDDPELNCTTEVDAVHPLDEHASNVKLKLYSDNIMLGFPAGFEPDSIEIIGWDDSPSGLIIYNPKSTYENDFSSAEDFTGMFQVESNTVYMVTVTYDILKYAERGFYGSADYYFETGNLNE